MATPRIATLISAGLLALVPVGIASPASATYGGDSGRIVFGQANGDDIDLYSINADGTDPRALTANEVQERDAVWSPDGRRIAFVRESPADQLTCCPPSGDIWVMDADGSNARQVTDLNTGVGSPSWSPDGKRLAFLVDYHRLVTMPAEGGALRTVLSRDGWFMSGPRWSPDGTTIALAALRSSSSHDLWLVQPNGANLRRLTTHNGADEYLPRWSPDSSRLVYTQTLRDQHRIRTIKRDGSGATLLPVVGAYGAAFSPDGSRLVFDMCSQQGCGLHTSTVAGSDVERIANNAGSGPDWQALP